jgi:hypothetical protein
MEERLMQSKIQSPAELSSPMLGTYPDQTTGSPKSSAATDGVVFEGRFTAEGYCLAWFIFGHFWVTDGRAEAAGR